MFTLSEEAKATSVKIIGLTVDEMRQLTCDEMRAYIEKKIGKKLTFPQKPDSRFIVRGNPLIAAHRWIFPPKS